jgi:hypothetical protein
MARRTRAADIDPFADLARKVAVLEREMEIQRIAMERLKQLGSQAPMRRCAHVVTPVRKTA